MKLISINWTPNNRQLRQFGLASMVLLPIAGWFWSAGDWRTVGIWSAVGFLLAFVGWLAPRILAPVFIGLSLVTYPIGLLASELVLLITFFFVVTPLGILARCFGRDRLNRKIDKDADTYWEDRSPAGDNESYFKQW